MDGGEAKPIDQILSQTTTSTYVVMDVEPGITG
jgi:hypothetical protein